VTFEERINEAAIEGKKLLDEGKMKESLASFRKVRDIWGESVRASELALQMSVNLLNERKEKYQKALQYEAQIEMFIDQYKAN
jgi:hypothetical protein